MSMNKFDSHKSYGSDSDDSDIEQSIDLEKLPPLEPGPGEHRLQYTYCLWFSKKVLHRPPNVTPIKAMEEYSKSLHLIGRCATVEQFWSLYCHLVRPTALKPYRELHFFKSGIKPMWEDPSNAKGGKWVIRLQKNKLDRAWENVCMAMLGEQFLVGPEICGVVLSTKYPMSGKEGFLSIWNRTATDQVCTARIRDTLRRILNLPPNVLMEYKAHCDSLKYGKNGPFNQQPSTTHPTNS